jgi:hypothetical protein
MVVGTDVLMALRMSHLLCADHHRLSPRRRAFCYCFPAEIQIGGACVPERPVAHSVSRADITTRDRVARGILRMGWAYGSYRWLPHRA